MASIWNGRAGTLKKEGAPVSFSFDQGVLTADCMAARAWPKFWRRPSTMPRTAMSCMDPQQALDAPRVFYNDDTVEAERNVPAEAIEGLRKRGHRVVEPQHPLGGGQAVLIDWEKGTLTGASDPRKDGMALGY